MAYCKNCYNCIYDIKNNTIHGTLSYRDFYHHGSTALKNKELDGGEDADVVKVSWDELLIESDDIPKSDAEVV